MHRPSRINDRLSYCKDRSAKFTEDAVQSIRSELMERWPSVDGNNVKFWAHEWNKHGTCGMHLQQLDTEFKYFQQAVNWHREFSVEKFLADASIYPNDIKGYKLNDVRAALKSKLGVDANIFCQHDKVRSE